MSSPEFVEAVLEVVSEIPAGHVMTYGDIAWALGSRAPRMVGKVMAHYGHTVAWWRVVPASGQPPKFHSGEALQHYLEEGTPLKGELVPEGYRIELRQARLTRDHAIYGANEYAP